LHTTFHETLGQQRLRRRLVRLYLDTLDGPFRFRQSENSSGETQAQKSPNPQMFRAFQPRHP
jgi:hypothetical protein